MGPTAKRGPMVGESKTLILHSCGTQLCQPEAVEPGNIPATVWHALLPLLQSRGKQLSKLGRHIWQADSCESCVPVQQSVGTSVFLCSSGKRTHTQFLNTARATVGHRRAALKTHHSGKAEPGECVASKSEYPKMDFSGLSLNSLQQMLNRLILLYRLNQRLNDFSKFGCNPLINI